MTATITDPLAFLLLDASDREDILSGVAATLAAEKEARVAAERAAEAAKVAEYKVAGFFFNTANRRYECARCSGRGVLQQYRHVAGGVCFNCDGEGFRL